MPVRREAVDFATVAQELYPWNAPNRPTLGRRRDALILQGRLTPAVQEAYEKAEQIKSGIRAVYVAGALTGVDEQTKARYAAANEFLMANYGDLFFGYVPNLHGTDPVKHPNVTAQEVRNIDNLWADGVADFGINFLDPLAHGNAIEEGWQEKSMIPSLFLAPKGMQLSRLVRGMENAAKIIYYENFETDGLEQLKIYFDEFAAWLRYFPNRDPREFLYLSYENLRDALMRKNGLDPQNRNTLFTARDFLVYVKDPSEARYGQVGVLPETSGIDEIRGLPLVIPQGQLGWWWLLFDDSERSDNGGYLAEGFRTETDDTQLSFWFDPQPVEKFQVRTPVFSRARGWLGLNGR